MAAPRAGAFASPSRAAPRIAHGGSARLPRRGWRCRSPRRYGCLGARRCRSRASQERTKVGWAGSCSAWPPGPSASPTPGRSTTSPPACCGSPARSLQRILDEECDQVLESLDMDFTIMEEGGSMVPVELKENGANIPVTKYNRKEFVDLYVNYVLNKSIQKPFEDFMQGFLRGCPAKQWKIFLPAELQIVIQGHTEFDWNLLEKNVKYIHYKELDQTIRNFWAVFHKLPEEKKKMFLAFLSGSDRIPACEMEHFSFYIVDPQAENPDECYFFANTCRRILFLPRYSNKRILKKKLLCTIEHNENFGLR